MREVAAVVRSGAAPDAAWAAVGVRARDGVPDAAGLLAAGTTAPAAAALVAAGRLVARAGAPPGPVLDAVAAALDADERAAAARRAALAGPAASARLLAWLPVVGPVLGLALGVDPGAATSGGLAWVVGAGVLASASGRAWSAALVRGAARAGDDGRAARGTGAPRRSLLGDPGGRAARLRAGPSASAAEVEVPLPVVLELLAAASAAGASVPGALRSVGAAVGAGRGAALGRAAARLARGSTWAAAWQGADPDLLVLAAALRPAWAGGAAPAPLLHAAAGRVQAGREARAAEAAGRLGVRLLGPLAVCHLPAFVLVGLVPVLVSLARSSFTAA